MTHRKRNQMHHKVELSTLLRIVVTRRLIQQNKQADKQLLNSLANEAIESLKRPEVFKEGLMFTKTISQEAFV
jgi:hypothetical protein